MALSVLGSTGDMEQSYSLVDDALAFLSMNPAAYAVVATIVGGPFIIVAAYISRGGSGRRLDRKRRKLISQLKKTCPHIIVERSGGMVRIQSLCSSVGSNPWSTCNLCGKRFTRDEERVMVEQWLERSLEQPFRIQTEAFQKSVALSEELAELVDDPRRAR